MAGAGLGRGMALVAVAEHRRPDASRAEPAGELRAIFVEQVGGELVDRDGDEEFRGAGLDRDCRHVRLRAARA